MPDSLSRFDVRDTVVSVDRRGVVSSVAHAGRPTLSYLRMDLPTALAPEWSSTGLAIDDDEVEATYTGDAGLELTVRHTFVAGWQFRCALYNSSTDTRSVRLRLPLSPGRGDGGPGGRRRCRGRGVRPAVGRSRPDPGRSPSPGICRADRPPTVSSCRR